MEYKFYDKTIKKQSIQFIEQKTWKGLSTGVKEIANAGVYNSLQCTEKYAPTENLSQVDSVLNETANL